jgi:hypothetical protein
MSGAETRFNNDLKRGAQMQLGPGGMAASTAFRPNSTASKPKGAPVGGPPSSPNGSPPHPLQGQSWRPQGAPQAPPAPGGNSSDLVGRLVQELQFEKLLTSPEVHEANELENFRDSMLNREPGPDRGSRVLSRLSSYNT